MANPPGSDPAQEIARLREEVAELRARIAALEDYVGLHGREAAAPPPMAAPPGDFDPFAPSIEPSEPWGLKPPGGGSQP
ncbi:hypothetical protein [Falsiroseomonas sp.]|uniref:hypothetical protein n=1 Tax=Falsiroseomonas sp. TaxID=2870721 RepID=UPI003567FC1D